MAVNPIEIKNAVQSPELRPRNPESAAPSPEIMGTPEALPAEKGAGEISRPELSLPNAAAATAPAAISADEAHLKYQAIEKVLEEDLGEIYNSLAPAEQKLFKLKGEEAAKNIFKLVYHQSKIKVKKIIKAIRDWLKSVPGMNKFFLEQEAKLKADKIVKLADPDQVIDY